MVFRKRRARISGAEREDSRRALFCLKSGRKIRSTLMNIIKLRFSSYSLAVARPWPLAFFSAAIVMLLPAPQLNAQYVDWIRQMGTSGVDGFWGVSVDPVNDIIFAVGDTAGNLFGP